MKWYVLIVFLFILTSKEKSMDDSRKTLKENRTKVAKVLKKAQDSGV